MGMAWCPQCKNEYREGVKICADCGCELVEEEQYTDLIPLTFGEEEKLIVLKKYLEYNKLKGVTISFDEKDNVFVLFVREKDKKSATAMTKVFFQQEYARAQEALMASLGEEGETTEETEDTQEDSEATGEETAEPLIYCNSSERAEENRSSAWTLLFVGGVGLVLMVLCIAGIIPLRLGNPYMFYGVMCAVFLLFIVMGLVSMKNAKLFAKKAESENTLRDAMTNWYRTNLSGEALDAELKTEEDISEEILYFKRVQKIKDMFNHQFMNLDQVFLEHYIDEEVYDYVFSAEKE